MNNELHDHNKTAAVDDDIINAQNNLRMGRLALDFEGMDTMTILQRAEYVRHSLHEDWMKRPENANRLIGDVSMECDREEYLPNVHLICEKMITCAEKRYEKAAGALTSAQNNSPARPGKKAAGVRRSIDANMEADAARRLSEERRKINAQKKEMETYIKMAPDSSYAALIRDILRQNEKSYQLTSRYLSAMTAAGKYDRYEKLGVLIEEEKKLRTLAREKEQAAKLNLDNHKQSTYALLERDALLRLNNRELMRQAHAGLLNCAKTTLAFIAIPKEMTERLLEYGLTECEERYYQALQTKESLTGFHPFKKMALNREIKKAAKEYGEGLALLPDTAENRLKHPPLTTLEQWKKQNSIPEEKITESGGELIAEIPVEIPVGEAVEAPEGKQPIQLDLGDKIHAPKTAGAPAAKVGMEKEIPAIEKEI